MGCPMGQSWQVGRVGHIYMMVSGRGNGGHASLRGVGHLPHDDVAALSLREHGLHLVHVPRTLLCLIVFSIAWRERWV